MAGRGFLSPARIMWSGNLCQRAVVCPVRPVFRGSVISTELRTRSRNLCLTSWTPHVAWRLVTSHLARAPRSVLWLTGWNIEGSRTGTGIGLSAVHRRVLTPLSLRSPAGRWRKAHTAATTMQGHRPFFRCGGLAGEWRHHTSTRRHRGLRGVRPQARPRARELGQHPGRSACLQPAPLQDEEVWPVTRAWLRDGTELPVSTHDWIADLLGLPQQ